MPFITFSISSFISLIKNKKFDVLFVVFPILPIALSSLLFSKIFNKKIVFGVKDLSVEGLRASKKIKSKTILNFLDWFEVTIYKRADLIQVTSKQQFNYFYSRGISKNKIEFIPDWGDSEKISLIEPDSYMLNRFKGNSKKIIIYSGNIGLSSELKTIVKVMKRFSPDEIKLLITGDGVMKKELVEFVIENNIRNVEFSDFVPYEDLGKLLSIADICLVTLNKQFTKVATQGKIYNILAAGKPIFAIMEEDAEFVKEIKKENLGLLAEPDDEESIYKQLKKVVDDKISFANSNEIRHFFMNNYTINQIMPKYHALFKKLEKKMNYKNIVVTGGSGFIGSHFCDYLLEEYEKVNVINVDKLTYASDFENYGHNLRNDNYFFEEVDINSEVEINRILSKYEVDAVVNFAAESHVDNSIGNPLLFAETNVLGTLNLLNCARKKWSKNEGVFLHVSTDEVFGSLAKSEAAFTESSKYDPKSPYSASKAASDFFVRAFANTYEMNIKITNCSNNYGSRQDMEKFIPKSIMSILTGKKIEIYGSGNNVRDWIHVRDHCSGILKVLNDKSDQKTFLLGSNNEFTNNEIARKIIDIHNLIFPQKMFQKRKP